MRKESRKEKQLDKKAKKARVKARHASRKVIEASELAVENVGQRVRHSSKQGIKLFHGDYDFGILVSVLGLTLFGIAMVFSASYYSALNDPDVANPYYYLIRQGFWACAGIVALIFGSALNYRVFGNRRCFNGSFGAFIHAARSNGKWCDEMVESRYFYHAG